MDNQNTDVVMIFTFKEYVLILVLMDNQNTEKKEGEEEKVWKS